jgi:hypothetical protein
MKKILIVLLFLLGATSLFAQLVSKAHFNRTALEQTIADRPWAKGGIRSVHVANDLDGDGKLEIIATDYSNGGRVHVLEYVDNEVLEVVWSSPIIYDTNPNSIPRWVQTGDLDGDGFGEIIFPCGPTYTGGVQVFEIQHDIDGNITDNDYGTRTVIDFPADMLVASGSGSFRLDRNCATVADFDGDGKDELILSNADNNVYILTISGDAPGFASWVVEAGNQTNQSTATVTTGSAYQSISADINGDGINEIINHQYNNFGLSSINVTGPDSYEFPSPNGNSNAEGPSYCQYLSKDGVAFFGLAKADVDGDGKDEIASVVYPDYNIALISQPKGITGTAIWDASKFSVLKQPWELSATGDSATQYWACYAADINGNGIDEILAGGFYGENVVAVEYKGIGDIMDGNNYDVMHYYGGEKESIWEWEFITISDSAGTIDTSYSKGAWGNPGVMRMASGDIIGNDGKPELVIAYQANVYDSMTVVTRTWDGTTWLETEGKIFNDHNIQIRVLQYDNGTGVIRDLNIVTPNDYVLAQNYPNPFNPTTNIRFSLPVSKKVTITIYDMLGSEVKTLVNNQEFAKGSYEATWDGTNNFGSKVASGNYIATMKYGNFNQSIKMQLLK